MVMVYSGFAQPVVQNVNSTIHQINLYPETNAKFWFSLIVIYLVDNAIQCLNNRGMLKTLITFIETRRDKK